MYIELTKVGLKCQHGPLEPCSKENTTIIKGKILIKESDILYISEQPTNTENYEIGVKTIIGLTLGEKVFVEEDYEKVKLLASSAALHDAKLHQKV